MHESEERSIFRLMHTSGQTFHKDGWRYQTDNAIRAEQIFCSLEILVFFRPDAAL
jgi:hypothetical protein